MIRLRMALTHWLSVVMVILITDNVTDDNGTTNGTDGTTGYCSNGKNEYESNATGPTSILLIIQ